MKENYINELSKVHAPKELIEETKLAMHLEEERIKKDHSGEQRRNDNDKKVTLFFKAAIPVAAAAVAAVLVIMFVPGFFRQGQSFESTETLQEDFIQNGILLEQLDLKPDKIVPGSSELKNIETFIVEQYPEEFLAKDVNEKKIEGIQVRFLKDKKTGFYKAVFTLETDKILVVSELIELDRIVTAVKEVIEVLNVRTEE